MAKRKINSKKKGSAGELELSNVFKEHGYNTRRSVQYNGKADDGKADIIGLNGFHIECKRVEKLQLSKAMAQAMHDSDKEEIPIVCHRKSREPWYVTLTLEDFFSIIENLNLKNTKIESEV